MKVEDGHLIPYLARMWNSLVRRDSRAHRGGHRLQSQMGPWVPVPVLPLALCETSQGPSVARVSVSLIHKMSCPRIRDNI